MANVPTLDELKLRAWPEGIPTRDELAIQRLPDSGRETVRRRLAAVLRWTEPTDGEPRFDGAADAATFAGLATSHFYQLVRDWKARRSVESLGVVGKAGTKRRSAVSDAVKAEISTTIAEVLDRDPNAGTNAILDAIAARHAGAPSRTTLIRMITEARRERRSGSFGADIAFDSAGLDLADPEGHHLRLDAVVDVGTGVVLGWVVATARWGATGYVHAADAALDGLADLDLEGVSVADGEPDVMIRVRSGDAAAERIFGGTGLPLVTPNGIDRLGRIIVDAIGDRIGPTWLGVGERPDGVSFRTGRAAAMPEISSAMIDTIRETIDRNNGVRLERARQNGIGGSADSDGVRNLLRRVADLRSRIDDDR
ncbi:hypothetical protein [Sphingomonas oryzagri]|uniref:hypothetical protein n=1 Tax=Sphingomonas oryzagri TaxID=3042314 RepID=UPI00247A8441|nr:hypothetical protein [Sphingomonas oryzagri]